MRIPAKSISIIEHGAGPALAILPRDTRNFVIGFAKAEGKSPEVLMAEWVRERAEEEHKLANEFADTVSA